MARKIITIDCETDPFKKDRLPQPFIWGLYDGKNFIHFANISALLDYLREIDCIVYAHNGGKFDYHFMLDYMEPFSDILIINGRLAKFKIGNAEFRDSYNILPVPLSAMKKDTFDYTKLESDRRGQHMPEIIEYLKNDCVYLHQFVTKFNDDYGINLTLAGAAIKQWRKISGISCEKSNRYFYELMSPYYYGGRTQAFKSGIIETPFVYADMISAYPAAMMLNHPWGLERDTGEQKGAIVDQNFYTVNARSKGCFPKRDKHGLTFPNDNQTREFKITGWELNAAIDTGCFDGDIINQTVFYDQIDFKSYVNKFFDLKEQSLKGTPSYLFAKLMLNSLYGKFGANPDNYYSNIIIDQQFIEAAEIDGHEFAGLLGKWALLKAPLEDEEKRFYNVATAASITGQVRSKLWREICKIGIDNVIYCDTDSLMYFGEPPTGKKLGEFKLEAICDFGAIAGKKLYCVKSGKESYTATKGCRLSDNQIIDIANGAIVEYENDAPSYSHLQEPKFLKRKIQKTS
jgi:hypothetical protein